MLKLEGELAVLSNMLEPQKCGPCNVHQASCKAAGLLENSSGPSRIRLSQSVETDNAFP